MTNGVNLAQEEGFPNDSYGEQEIYKHGVPVFSGVDGWYQHIHIVQAIVKSNGWPDETAALQLFVHLKGEALDVVLLLQQKRTGVMDRTGAGTGGILPISGQAGRAVRERVPSTGIGSSYIRN